LDEERERPDPDALLRRIQAEHEREARAKLKVWLGFAPGVGKTYAMLANARELQSAGSDVVVGWAETHATTPPRSSSASSSCRGARFRIAIARSRSSISTRRSRADRAL
jgi:hypothetical protein